MWMAEHRERYKDDGRRYPSDLTQTEWETIAPFITDYRTLTVDMREVVNACLYLQNVRRQDKSIRRRHREPSHPA